MVHGYHGKYLRIDVSRATAEKVPLSAATLRRFLGGAGLGTAILLREGAAEADPLHPEAVLVFAFSPLVGSPLTTSAKFAVVSKSPLTARINDSLASSGFAIAGKKAGCDAVAITGRAPELSVIIVDDGHVRVEPVPELLGQHCSDAAARLKQKYGQTYQVAVIGPAGENQVRYATISHDGRHAGRGGSGAVLGAKNIKAVLVRGTQHCTWADPTRVVAFAKSLSSKSLGPATAKYRELGTATNLLLFNRLQALPTRNFQGGSFTSAQLISPEALAESRQRTRASCVACTIGCEHLYEVRDTEGGSRPVRLEYENLFALGPLCGIDDAEAVLQASHLCDELGMDTISAGGTIAFAMECVERGMLDEPWLQFGNAAAIPQALDLICRRDGIGELLAEGSLRFSRHVGRNSVAFTSQVKGLELPGYEPRALQTMALGFAVGSRGADHNRSGAYEADFSGAVDRHAVSLESARRAVETEDRAALMDSLILCKFLRGVFSDFFSEAAEMLHMVTGWDVTGEELQVAARRIATLRKLFNERAGWQPEEDTLPARFFREEPEESDAPCIDQAAFKDAVQGYYLARGWSVQGWIDSATLTELGLNDFTSL